MKSGGPEMTIKNIEEDGTVSCRFYDPKESTEEGRQFPACVLKPVRR